MAAFCEFRVESSNLQQVKAPKVITAVLVKLSDQWVSQSTQSLKFAGCICISCLFGFHVNSLIYMP